MIRYLLFPFAVLYHLITAIRNFLFDKGFFKSYRSEVLTISVGNLTVGGTGKTPHIEYLIDHFLGQNQTLATLSRGYGRKTKGYLLANENLTAAELGDEPMQFFEKYGSKIKVAVCEKRVLGVEKIRASFPEVSCILLDDAFQHRAIKPDFQILLSDWNRPFYKDFLLPMGRIRESRAGAKRADVILVSKCSPDISSEEKEKIRQKIRLYSSAPIFFTAFEYDEPIYISKKTNLADYEKRFGVISGIAKNQPFLDYVQKNFGDPEQIFSFPDHHDYSQDDLKKVKKHPHLTWLTTEKDAVKLRPLLEEQSLDISMAYIPIKVKFVDKNEENEFWSLIKSLFTQGF